MELHHLIMSKLWDPRGRTQIRRKEVVRYDKSKKHSDWSDKNLQTYKDIEKGEYDSVIISTLTNGGKRCRDNT